MVLHRDDRRFGVQRIVGVAHAQEIAKLQRCGAGKQDLSRRAEFNDGAFLKAWTRLILICAAAASELHRDANRRGLGEKTGQISDRAGLRRPRLSCGLLRQSDDDLSPGWFSPRLKFCSNYVLLTSFCARLQCGWAPLFPVRKSFGEPEHAVTAERDARPGPQCGTEGLALRR
jgi:hypothetical protein